MWCFGGQLVQNALIVYRDSNKRTWALGKQSPKLFFCAVKKASEHFRNQVTKTSTTVLQTFSLFSFSMEGNFAAIMRCSAYSRCAVNFMPLPPQCKACICALGHAETSYLSSLYYQYNGCVSQHPYHDWTYYHIGRWYYVSTGYNVSAPIYFHQRLIGE